MKQVNEVLLTFLLLMIIIIGLTIWFNPQRVRQWHNEFNNIEPTECDMIQKKIDLEKAEKRRLEAIRINKNFGITH